MIHCRLADLNIEINSMYEYLPIKLSKYFADFEKSGGQISGYGDALAG